MWRSVQMRACSNRYLSYYKKHKGTWDIYGITLELHWYCTGYALALLRIVREAFGGEEEEMKLMQVLSQKRYNPFTFS